MKFNIIGSIENTNFDARIFNASTFIGGCIGIISIILNQLGDYPVFYNIWLGFTAFIFLTLYYLSRFKNKTQYLKILFIINITFIIGGAWIYNEGIFGSTVFFFGFAFLGIPFIFQKNRILALTSIFVYAICMILFQLFFPDFIRPYPTELDKFIDISVVMLTMLIISAYTVMLFINYMKKEQKIIENQKKEILGQAEELKAINNKLVELDKFKELMSGMVIHDLKNPLNSIIGLSNQKCSDRNIKMIQQSSKQMLNLILNILDVQKFDTTELKLNCENIVLYKLLNNVLENISGIVEEKNIEILIEGNTKYNLFVDIQLIERVFINILSNAIKFSDNNAKITITIEDSDLQIKVSITDYGQGIEPENLAKVFDRFAQINPKKTGALRSTGLGLAFCKMVINAHNCEIGVNSNINEFTIFWVTLNKSVTEKLIIQSEMVNFSLKNEIFLTENDKIYLKKNIFEFKKLKYYEIGKLSDLVNQIDENFSQNVSMWKNEMEKSIFANNEQIFNQLINI